MLCSTKVAIAMTPVLHPSFLSERITPRLLTEARRAGLLSRAPVKSSFIGVPQWHLLAPNSEPSQVPGSERIVNEYGTVVSGKKLGTGQAHARPDPRSADQILGAVDWCPEKDGRRLVLAPNIGE